RGARRAPKQAATACTGRTAPPTAPRRRRPMLGLGASGTGGPCTARRPRSQRRRGSRVRRRRRAGPGRRRCSAPRARPPCTAAAPPSTERGPAARLGSSARRCWQPPSASREPEPWDPRIRARSGRRPRPERASPLRGGGGARRGAAPAAARPGRQRALREPPEGGAAPSGRGRRLELERAAARAGPQLRRNRKARTTVGVQSFLQLVWNTLEAVFDGGYEMCRLLLAAAADPRGGSMWSFMDTMMEERMAELKSDMQFEAADASLLDAGVQLDDAESAGEDAPGHALSSAEFQHQFKGEGKDEDGDSPEEQGEAAGGLVLGHRPPVPEFPMLEGKRGTIKKFFESKPKATFVSGPWKVRDKDWEDHLPEECQDTDPTEVEIAEVQEIFGQLSKRQLESEANKHGVSTQAFLMWAKITYGVALDEGADVQSTDRHGQTPLFFAPDQDICKLLVARRADVAALNHKGQTALHLAGRAGLKDVYSYLSSQMTGALADHTDMHGATALEYAKQAGASWADTSTAFSASRGRGATSAAARPVQAKSSIPMPPSPRGRSSTGARQSPRGGVPESPGLDKKVLAGPRSEVSPAFARLWAPGVLKSMFAEKGFGFVTPDDGSDDCFVHVKDNPELDGIDSGGDAVTFDKEWDDRKGKYKGVNCRALAGAMSSRGTLKNFFEEKGFGFITPDDGSEDVFAHVKENPALNDCQQGDSVSYDAEYDDRKGKYKGKGKGKDKGGKGGYAPYGKGW
ncbi:unnamed protein product, partial [Prorocentrum cordatum]